MKGSFNQKNLFFNFDDCEKLCNNYLGPLVVIYRCRTVGHDKASLKLSSVTNPMRKSIGRCKLGGCGFKYLCRQRIFSPKKLHKSFFYDHHVMEFVYYLSVRCTMYQLYHVYRWQRWQICPNSNKELFEQLKM